MSSKFQQLFLQILEDVGNSAGPGGSFGPNDAYSNPDNIDTKFAMAITGKASVGKPRKKKKLNFPLIRRKLDTSL